MNKNPFVKVGVLGLALCMALVTPGCGVCGFGPGQVLIRDPQLELALRQALNVPFACITRADMLTLTDLDASAYGIVNLDGLETARNLVNLDLTSNYIKDIAPLRDLDKIVHLDLAFNGIDVIEPIAGLDSLRFVNFTCNTGIRNWDPVAAVVTTNNGYREGGEVIFDEKSSTLICTVVDAEGNETEQTCYTDSFLSAAGAIDEYARGNGYDIDIVLGIPDEGTTVPCGF